MHFRYKQRSGESFINMANDSLEEQKANKKNKLSPPFKMPRILGDQPEYDDRANVPLGSIPTAT